MDLLNQIQEALRHRASGVGEGVTLPSSVLSPPAPEVAPEDPRLFRGRLSLEGQTFMERRVVNGRQWEADHLERWLSEVRNRLRVDDSECYLNTVFDYIEAVGAWSSHTSMYGDPYLGAAGLLEAWSIVDRWEGSWSLSSTLGRVPGILGSGYRELSLHGLLLARNNYTNMGDSPRAVYVLLSLANLYSYKGDWRAVQNIAREGIALCSNVGPEHKRSLQRPKVIFFIREMITAMKLNDHGRARAIADGIEEMRGSYPLDQVFCQGVEAACHWSEGHWDFAELCYEEALKKTIVLHPSAFGSMAFDYASMMAELGRTEKVEAIMKRALNIEGGGYAADAFASLEGTALDLKAFGKARGILSEWSGYMDLTPGPRN